MLPLLITAHLVNGFVTSDPWSPALDGLLAAVLMRERLGEEGFVFGAIEPSKMRPVEGLPLERIGDDGLWWYACSSPIYNRNSIVDRKWMHRRFDEAFAIEHLPQSRKVTTVAGPYKDYRLSELRRVVPAVYWHAIGDKSEIERLLRSVPAIGAGRGRGHGEVADWTVEPVGNAEIATRHRPLPVAYAARHEITGTRMAAGIRPPARLPINICDCIVPGDIE